MSEALASSEQVGSALHVGPAAIRKYARAGRIPFVTTPGGHRRYDLEAVRAALAVTVGADEPIPPGDYDDVANPGPKDVLDVETEFLGVRPSPVNPLSPTEWDVHLTEDGLG